MLYVTLFYEMTPQEIEGLSRSACAIRTTQQKWNPIYNNQNFITL